MLEYITNTLQQAASQPLGLVFAMLLGVVSAATSACCTLPAMGILVGYSGTRVEVSRRDVFRSALFFTLGTVISLMIIGGIAGFVGQVAQNSLGRYWKVFAGIVAIIFSLATLKLLPFKLSFGNFGKAVNSSGKIETVLAGIVMGGIVAVSSLPCNPGIFIVLGAAILQGMVIWATLLLAMFAVGFSIPLGVVLLGVSLGKTTLVARNADTAIRWLSGSILLAAGFYFLITF
jgi:cytochrome c biogenesis protein CcdA